ncbi:hypothetical protein [Sphingobacterium griseoflavum]|uniref:Uncharacterized protein n=1 Tax=Sphingobacterium griseoflavum TaxID=1474952 RepID=A0ABQ3HUX1_9SPHI|nr:hypothetical protein [Sphingobacterium griseoflavum]GHE36955.1 hypothetical protein GCM10017764_20210 [Sphingobacterium griseoflavum]
MYKLIRKIKVMSLSFAVFVVVIGHGCSGSSPITDELQKVIQHYGSDKEKVAAVHYLAKSLSLHTMIVVDNEDQLHKGMHYVDSCYYALAKGRSLDELSSGDFKGRLNELRKSVDSALVGFKKLKPRVQIGPAEELITAAHIIEHVDHAFFIREQIKFVSDLSLEKFMQYFIPFENTVGYPIRKTNKYFSAFFSKYLPQVEKSNVPEVVKFYHTTVDNFRYLCGQYPFDQKLGFEELLFTDVAGWDCFDVSSFGAFSLNAFGVPTGVAYYCGFKSLNGIHSFNFIESQLGNYSAFSLEGGYYYPVKIDERYQPDDQNLNIYRILYEHAPNSPFNLSENPFDIPDNLRDPLISDITSQFYKTGKLHVKFAEEHDNEIIYLCNFSSRSDLVPVTWGKTNGRQGHFFAQVVPERLYFPCRYDEERGLSPIGNPFMVQMIDHTMSKREYVGSSNRLSVNLLRKYPVKKHTKERIAALVGTAVLASDRYDFGDGSVDTLYLLKHDLTPYRQDLYLNNNRPYQFYKILAPAERPNLHLAEVYFLSRARYGYENIAVAPKLPNFPGPPKKDDSVWVLDGPLAEMTAKAEYDGNVQTAPSAYPSVSLNLKEAQVIDRVRVCPLNEQNGIDVGDVYTLYTWTANIGWTPIETKKAAGNYLPFKDMYVNKLYWLKNDTKGKEEMLFTIDEKGNQQFIYNE